VSLLYKHKNPSVNASIVTMSESESVHDSVGKTNLDEYEGPRFHDDDEYWWIGNEGEQKKHKKNRQVDRPAASTDHSLLSESQPISHTSENPGDPGQEQDEISLQGEKHADVSQRLDSKESRRKKRKDVPKDPDVFKGKKGFEVTKETFFRMYKHSSITNLGKKLGVSRKTIRRIRDYFKESETGEQTEDEGDIQSVSESGRIEMAQGQDCRGVSSDVIRKERKQPILPSHNDDIDIYKFRNGNEVTRDSFSELKKSKTTSEICQILGIKRTALWSIEKYFESTSLTPKDTSKDPNMYIGVNTFKISRERFYELIRNHSRSEVCRMLSISTFKFRLIKRYFEENPI
jgi:hypothetical protein